MGDSVSPLSSYLFLLVSRPWGPPVPESFLGLALDPYWKPLRGICQPGSPLTITLLACKGQSLPPSSPTARPPQPSAAALLARSLPHPRAKRMLRATQVRSFFPDLLLILPTSRPASSVTRAATSQRHLRPGVPRAPAVSQRHCTLWRSPLPPSMGRRGCGWAQMHGACVGSLCQD